MRSTLSQTENVKDIGSFLVPNAAVIIILVENTEWKQVC